ncbi:MAG: NYN domain-containing protein [Actinomycetota bacterium]
MTDLVIVDGYNFIFNFVKAKGMNNEALAFYRDRLINDLVSYHHHKKRDITVVFDARHSDNLARSSQSFGPVRVIYSRKGETADSVIEKLAKNKGDYDRVYVVTSDYMQQKVVFRGNIYRISSREFGLELNYSKMQVKEQVDRINRGSRSSFYSLSKRISKKTIDDFIRIRKN